VGRSLKFTENFARICGDASWAVLDFSCRFFPVFDGSAGSPNWEVGMADADDVSSALAAASQPRPRERREERRRSVLWTARLMITGQRDIRCYVLDLAPGGAKLRIERPVALGTVVKLSSPRVVRAGSVVWSAGDCIGLRFGEAGRAAPVASSERS
jgi:PilZ domain-containing protein